MGRLYKRGSTQNNSNRVQFSFGPTVMCRPPGWGDSTKEEALKTILTDYSSHLVQQSCAGPQDGETTKEEALKTFLTVYSSHLVHQSCAVPRDGETLPVHMRKHSKQF
jgi:hypothetical protein